MRDKLVSIILCMDDSHLSVVYNFVMALLGLR